ncbi:hypothetical protein EZS27_011128 [termite gut metagenome]|uniref:Uncharacterized protein n=1 Tax=termite gut metagenome TaxID=433724 RepID=A0A5J4S487_9ZZZZ
MRKITYIKLSHAEANNRIWRFLIEKYKFVKQRNKPLAYLWLIVAFIGFGFVAVFSWFAYLTVFFQDIRFTPHYLRTVIRHNQMTIVQANSYLNAQMLKYKTSLSHGHFSLKEQSSIEATFDLLYKEFSLPENSDEQIISHIDEVKQIVIEGNTEIKAVSAYTNRKSIEEQKELERKERLEAEQAKRISSANNRNKGRMLNSFESDLSDEQLNTLTKCCNAIPIFNRDIELYELKEILACSHTKPLQLDVNKHLALLFDQLSKQKLICKTWMSVAERGKCFLSKQEKFIVSKDLSSALSAASTIKWEVETDINKWVKTIVEQK